MAHKFRGFYSPRATQVPDNFFDEVMADLSGAELKVLLYIFRRTFGFKKDADNISLSQMVRGITKRNGEVLDYGTGLGKGSVARALNSLVAKGMIRKTKRHSQAKGDEATTYEPVLADWPPVSQNGTGGVPNSDGGVSQGGTHNNTVNKQQLDKTVNGKKKSPVRDLPGLVQPPDKAAYIAGEILEQLGDRGSEKFYRLVAAKVPEAIIREALAQITSDGAHSPARAFTYRMNQYAMSRLRGIGTSRRRTA